MRVYQEVPGVEFGIYKNTGSPVVIDILVREEGYTKFTIGDPGSGKSFGSKQNFIRTIQQDSDRIGVTLEPLGNWTGVAETLGVQRITVKGHSC